MEELGLKEGSAVEVRLSMQNTTKPIFTEVSTRSFEQSRSTEILTRLYPNPSRVFGELPVPYCL
jgi:hypothetical protein